MKTTSLLSRIFAASVLGLTSGFGAFTQAQTGNGDPRLTPAVGSLSTTADRASNQLEVAPPEAVERGLRKLAGKSVQSSNGEKLGTIRDFVIDKKTGQVVYAVVSSGGALGVGNRLRLVPIAALQPAPAGSDGYIVKMDRVSWDRTSPISSEAFNDGILFVSEEQQRQLAEAFATERRASPQLATTTPPSDGLAANVPVGGDRAAQRAASPFVRASDLRDRDLQSRGEELGEVEDVIINFATGQAHALVELEDDVIGRELDVLIPIEQLDLTNPRRELTTQLSRDDFRRVDPKARALAATPPARVEPSDVADAPTGRSSPHGKTVTSPAATLASAARSARQALDHHPDLARANITVAIVGETLRLEGSVATEPQKKQAEATVKQAASGVKLENHLTVAP